jgi:prepilin-type N-terminal cleavage/methylation domain-containing protein
MCNAERSRGRRDRCRGFTMLEVAISLALVTGMALIVERSLGSTRDAEDYLSAVRKAAERGHKLAYEIRQHVTASRRLFSDDDVGRDYLAALDLSRAPLLASARMPFIGTDARLEPDEEGEPKTGNILLFASEMDARAAIADPSGPTVRYIDTYRFICCYPCERDRKVVVDGSGELARDLVVWQSVEFPSYEQLMEIEDDGERTSVVADIHDRYGHTMAWDPAGDVDGSFYTLDALGNVSGSPMTEPTISEDLDESRGGRLVYANVQLARTEPGDRRRRAILSADDPEAWSPDGFEVKVAGSTGSRTVWLHVVVEVPATKGRVATQPCTIIASVKDM